MWSNLVFKLQEPVSIGASVTLSNLAAMMTSLGALPGYEYLTEFVGLIGNVAHLPVRNVSTLSLYQFN